MTTVLISALASVLVAVIGVIAARRKTNADAAERITAAAGNLTAHFDAELARLSDRHERLRRRVEELESEVETLREWKYIATNYIKELVAQLRRNHIDVPVPPDNLGLKFHQEPDRT